MAFCIDDCGAGRLACPTPTLDDGAGLGAWGTKGACAGAIDRVEPTPTEAAFGFTVITEGGGVGFAPEVVTTGEGVAGVGVEVATTGEVAGTKGFTAGSVIFVPNGIWGAVGTLLTGAV